MECSRQRDRLHLVSVIVMNFIDPTADKMHKTSNRDWMLARVR